MAVDVRQTLVCRTLVPTNSSENQVSAKLKFVGHQPRPELFIPQGVNRIERRGFARRIVTKENSDHYGKDNRAYDCHHRDQCRPTEQLWNRQRRWDAQEDA